MKTTELETLIELHHRVATLKNRIRELTVLKEKGQYHNSYIVHQYENDGLPDDSFIFCYADVQFLLPALDSMISATYQKLHKVTNELQYELSLYTKADPL